MKEIRVRRALGVEYMKNLLLDDDDFDRDRLAEGLTQMLEQSPENVFILQAWDKNAENEDVIKAFIIALAPLNQQKFVFLQQAWTDKDTNPNVADKMFLKLLMWTHDIGRSEIRAETLRDPRAFNKRWKFSEYSTIIRFKLDDDFENKLFDHLFNTQELGAGDGQGLEVRERDADQGNSADADSGPAASKRIVKFNTGRSSGLDHRRKDGRSGEAGADGSSNGDSKLSARSGDDEEVLREVSAGTDAEGVREGSEAED